MLNTIKYATGFSSGALLVKEADVIVEQIKDSGEFINDLVTLNYNSIPVNSESSQKRLGIEVVKRLKNLKNPIFIELYKIGTLQDKQIVLFYAACKTYLLITDFMLEVVLNKWYNLDLDLSPIDFQNYIYRIMGNYEELENLKPTTVKKLSSVVFKMLQIIGIVQNNKLHKIDFNLQILRAIANQGDRWFLELILLNKTEISELTD